MTDDTFRGLRLHNTLSRRKEDFRPIDAGNVRMYVCGPTVYDYAHIGNARPAIVFDVLFRLLRHLYGEDHVTYVRNITDVDDKINARAAEDYPDLPLNEAIRKVTAKTEEQYHRDVAALGNLPPTVEPRATEHIAEMQALIRTLIDKKHAYAADGHVLFDVKSWQSGGDDDGYGGLSRRSLDEMVAGARVEVAPYKRDPMDFVLWKPSSDNEPGWGSPWGRGRPGWHIECSAMAEKWLWTEAEAGLSEAGRAKPHQFDIHGGGIDLIFPHHENEVAQSRCAHGTPVMANYWLHNGFLQVEGQKMSKSLGNFITIHDLLTDRDGEKWSGLVVRLAILMTHYRQPIDFTKARLEEAAAMLSNWFDHIIAGVLPSENWLPEHVREVDVSEFMEDPDCVPSERLLAALNDDLNIPAAVTELHRLAGSDQLADRKLLCGSLRLLGFLDDTQIGQFIPVQAADSRRMITQAADIERLIADRAEARADKDWAKADQIRDQLDALGIALHDAKDPQSGELVTTWEVKR